MVTAENSHYKKTFVFIVVVVVVVVQFEKAGNINLWDIVMPCSCCYNNNKKS